MSDPEALPGAKLRALDFSPRTLSLLRPFSAPATYLGWRTRGDRVPIYAFFDHTCRRIAYPLRFAVTTCRDWQGGQRTYDKHLGTDFMVPIGTQVVAAAAGLVRKVSVEPVGGIYVWIDHGGGYSTTYHHLSMALVHVGQRVYRGELIALSGATGVAIQGFFPWVPPHLHFSLVVDGVPVDPFAGPESPGYWAGDSLPRPYGFEQDLDLELSWDEISREAMLSLFGQDPLLERNFTPPMQLLAPPSFSHGGDWRNLEGRPRLRLSLPFRERDFRGIALP